MKKILYVKPFGDSLLVYGLNDAGSEVTVPIRDVRCGIASPDDSCLEFYYLMLGQEVAANIEGKRPLVFLCEHANKSQDSFMMKLGEDMRRMMCRTVYADHSQKEFYSVVWKAIRSSSSRLYPAPFAGDVPYGKVLISEWLKDKAIVISENADTILRKQLETVSADSGNEPLGFHALRFVLGGFVRFPRPTRLWVTSPRKREGNPMDGWT